MKQIPPRGDLESIVVRVDFSSDAVWESIRAEIETPAGDFQARVVFVDDVDFDGVDEHQIIESIPAPQEEGFIFLVDAETIGHKDHPVLVVELEDSTCRTFRVVPSWVWSVQNNLVLCNMDWEDFAYQVDGDGIFRGF